jgi:hypothetical protein
MAAAVAVALLQMLKVVVQVEVVVDNRVALSQEPVYLAKVDQEVPDFLIIQVVAAVPTPLAQIRQVMAALALNHQF